MDNMVATGKTVGRGVVRKAAMIRQLRLPGLAVALAVSLLAALLPVSGAQAAGLPSRFYANIASREIWYECVNVRDNSTNAGGWIQGYDCDGTGASDFYFTSTGTDGFYEILGEHSNLCITPKDNPAHDGTPLIQWYCVGAQSQLWELRPAGDGIDYGSYELYNSAYGLCVTFLGYEQTMQIRACHGTQDQHFDLNNILPA